MTDTLDPILVTLGRHGSAESILAAARDNLRREFAMAALWAGARARKSESIIKGHTQMQAVAAAALSGPPAPFVRRQDMAGILNHVGYCGEDWLIILAAARIQGAAHHVQALLDGAARREKEHFVTGLRHRRDICRAVVAHLPDHALRLEPVFEDILQHMAENGSEDEVAILAARFGHDSEAAEVMRMTAEAAERADRSKAGLADLIADVFRKTTPLPPAATPVLLPGAHPLGLKKSALRL